MFDSQDDALWVEYLLENGEIDIMEIDEIIEDSRSEYREAFFRMCEAEESYA